MAVLVLRPNFYLGSILGPLIFGSFKLVLGRAQVQTQRPVTGCRGGVALLDGCIYIYIWATLGAHNMDPTLGSNPEPLRDARMPKTAAATSGLMSRVLCSSVARFRQIEVQADSGSQFRFPWNAVVEL